MESYREEVTELAHAVDNIQRRTQDGGLVRKAMIIDELKMTGVRLVLTSAAKKAHETLDLKAPATTIRAKACRNHRATSAGFRGRAR